MYKKHEPDFLYPIRTSGRKEIVAVTYDHIIRMNNEGILNYLIHDKYDDYIEMLPGLKTMKESSFDDKFTCIKSFSAEALLNILKNTNSSISKDTLYALQTSSSSIPTSQLRLNIGLSHLLINDNISKLYVVDPYMTNEKLYVLKNIFGELCNNRVFAVADTMINFVINLDEKLTTIMTYDVEDIAYLINSHEDKIKDVYFVCSGVYLSNYIPNNTAKNEPPYKIKYEELFKEKADKEICAVGYFEPVVLI